MAKNVELYVLDILLAGNCAVIMPNTFPQLKRQFNQTVYLLILGTSTHQSFVEQMQILHITQLYQLTANQSILLPFFGHQLSHLLQVLAISRSLYQKVTLLWLIGKLKQCETGTPNLFLKRVRFYNAILSVLLALSTKHQIFCKFQSLI